MNYIVVENKWRSYSIYMAIVRWNPLSEIEILRHQMDKMLDEMIGFDTSDQDIWKPAIELLDDEKHLTLRAEVPGIEAEQLDVNASREAVTIRGENRALNESQDKGYFRSEFRYGQFERTVRLPVPIDNDKIEANFKDGILTLTLPKAEEARNRVVKVSLSNKSQSAVEANSQ